MKKFFFIVHHEGLSLQQSAEVLNQAMDDGIGTMNRPSRWANVLNALVHHDFADAYDVGISLMAQGTRIELVKDGIEIRADPEGTFRLVSVPNGIRLEAEIPASNNEIAVRILSEFALNGSRAASFIMAAATVGLAEQQSRGQKFPEPFARLPVRYATADFGYE